MMLSGETAVGLFPVETVDFMRRICSNAEKYIENNPRKMLFHRLFPGVCTIAMVSPLMSHVEPVYLADLMIPVVVMSEDRRLLGRLCIYKGIIPVFAEGCCEEKVDGALVRLGLMGRCLVMDGEQAKIRDVC